MEILLNPPMHITIFSIFKIINYLYIKDTGLVSLSNLDYKVIMYIIFMCLKVVESTIWCNIILIEMHTH